MFDKEAPKPKISRKVTMGNFAFKDLNPVEVLTVCWRVLPVLRACVRACVRACAASITTDLLSSVAVGAAADVDGLPILQATDAL
jgi:hypothetical protein